MPKDWPLSQNRGCVVAIIPSSESTWTSKIRKMMAHIMFWDPGPLSSVLWWKPGDGQN